MRALTFSVVALVTGISTYAQGTVNFTNIGAGLNAPVFDVDGVTPLAGPAFRAQVYVGSSASESSLVAFPVTVPFIFSGYFQAGSRALPGFPPGSKPFFQVRAWEAAGGASYEAALAAGKKVGKSTVFQLQDPVGLSDPNWGPPPPLLWGLTSFSLVPEPSAIVLGAVGGAVLLLLGRVLKTVRRPASF